MEQYNTILKEYLVFATVNFCIGAILVVVAIILTGNAGKKKLMKLYQTRLLELFLCIVLIVSIVSCSSGLNKYHNDIENESYMEYIGTFVYSWVDYNHHIYGYDNICLLDIEDKTHVYIPSRGTSRLWANCPLPPLVNQEELTLYGKVVYGELSHWVVHVELLDNPDEK